MDIRDIIRCPKCHGTVDVQWACTGCGERYAFVDGIPNMVSETLSAGHWTWNPNIFEDRGDGEEDLPKVMGKGYSDFRNEASIQANVDLWNAMRSRIKGFHGVVCDLATGMGGMLRLLLDEGDGFETVATDVDIRVLAWDKRTIGKDFHAVATDGRYMAFRNDAFDFIASYAGFGNIPETPKVAAELHRTLKPGGSLVFMATFVDEGTKSHELAAKHKLAFTERDITVDLLAQGFKDVRVDVLASAVWAENPFDLLPVADDTQHYAIITAEK